MRVRLLIIILVSVFLCACTADLVDAPPSAPSSPTPADHTLIQGASPALSWKAADAGGASYDVYLGTPGHVRLVASGLKQPHYKPSRELLRSTMYQWQVGTFAGGGIGMSELWSFTTGPGSSPDVPYNPSPPDASDQAIVNFAQLDWYGGDPDYDNVTYDLYFGRETNPPLLEGGLTNPGRNAPITDRGLYYWRVVAHDTYNLVTESPTWSFRVIPRVGYVYNWAGTGDAGTSAMGLDRRDTTLYWPVDVSFSPGGTPYVVDWNNHRIIATDANDKFRLIAGGVFGDPCLSAPAGCQNIVAAGCELNQPAHVTFDNNGNIVLSAWHNSELFRIDQNSGIMNRICGTGDRSFSPDGEPAATTVANLISSAAFDSQGRLYYTDQTNQVIRMIDANGIVHTVAGTNPVWDENVSRWNPQAGYAGDDGPATSALLNFDRGQLAMPSGRICFDASDNMYIADTGNHLIRGVSAGTIHAVAGFQAPRDVAVDDQGNVFVVDSVANTISILSNGVVTKIAGGYGNGGSGLDDGVSALYASFDSPMGIALDAHGNVWIADTGHSRIRILYR